VNEFDLTPEQLAEGRRTALTMIAAIASGDPRDADMASDVIRDADAASAVAGMCLLLAEVFDEHGEDLAGWAARKQDEAALLE
jgi:hypothetical protein